MVQFSGMEPWKEDYDIIEVKSKDRVLDLHNLGRVIAAEYRPPDVLNFRFLIDDPPWDLTLQFLNVAKIRVIRTELSTHDPDQLAGISFSRAERDVGRFEVILGDGLTYAFEASVVVATPIEPFSSGTKVCVRCNRRVERSAESYETFERMHWSCFHYEFEHRGDPDVACADLGCPARAFEPSPPPTGDKRR